MAKPIIAYESMLTEAQAVITDPGTEPGDFSIDNIYDFKSYTLWKYDDTSSPVNIDIDIGSGFERGADYVAVINHNMPDNNANISVFADNSPSPSTSVLGVTPVGDQVFFKSFTNPGTLRYWRVRFSSLGGFNNGKPWVGCIMLGLKTQMPEYLDPDFEPFFDDVEIAGSAQSEGGHYIASTARGHAHRARIAFGQAGASRSDLTAINAFLDGHAHLRKPFVFVLDEDDSEFDTARYVKLKQNLGSSSRAAVGESWRRLVLALDVDEAFQEPAS